MQNNSNIILKLTLAVIILPELPPEIMLNWIKAMKKSLPKMEKNLKKRIKNLDDFMENMVNPGLKFLKDGIDPKFVNKRRLNIDLIIQNALKDAPKSYEKYKQKIEELFKTVNGVHAAVFIERIMYGAIRYGEKMRLRVIPFIGYKEVTPPDLKRTSVKAIHNYHRGVACLAPRFLTGDKKAINELIKTDRLRQFDPINIIQPNMSSKFRQKCFYRLRQAGSEIMMLEGNQYTLDKENDQTNKLVNEFIRPDIVPFITGGNSHIDYVVESDQLFLDIQVSGRM